MNKLRAFWTKIKANKWKSIVALLVILLVLFFALGKGKGSGSDEFEVKSTTFEKVVSVSGKVVSTQTVDLSFESSGTVAGVYKKAGDKVRSGEVIAVLNSSDLQAERDSASADLLAARAELAKLTAQGSNDTETEINKRKAVDAISEAFTKADDAVRNKVDQYFDNPEDAPQIKYTFDDYFDRKGPINDERKKVEKALDTWEAKVTKLSTDNFSASELELSRASLNTIKTFLYNLSFAVNTFEESAILSQETIDKYKSDLYTARNNIAESLSNITTAQDSLRASFSDIPVQEAKVKAAEAKVKKLNAEIAKTVIVAPFSGVVSIQDAKVGASISAHDKVSAMISEGFEVEVYIPEVSLPGIAVGNTAKVTLDAYPDEELSAKITYIDPAETEKDGVSNYKVVLTFDTLDPRVRSGMTSSVAILTESVPGLIVIPERSVLKEGGVSYVSVKKGKEIVKTQIKTGRTDGKGNVEVTEGLSTGSKILITPVSK